MPFNYVVTTRIDSLIEEAFRQEGRPLLKIVHNEDVAFGDAGKVVLVKMHGSIEQKDSLVLTLKGRRKELVTYIYGRCQ
ncbi:SIR2 family protein [Chloroflexi bacterium TSY]|nr:SIR2 family protein [Chloroflexi bacterium TSY]